MRNLFFSACIIVVLWQVFGIVGASRQDPPSETFVRLMTPPGRSIASPIDNGYFMLLGLTTLPNSNPVQTGYDIWLESNGTQGRHAFDMEKYGRSDLHIPVAPDVLLPEWNSPTPLAEFHTRQVHARTSMTAYRALLTRYDQWLRMRFEDWSFAHRGAPRADDLLGAHRLYIADGFGHQTQTGIERLIADLAQWRSVLRQARTIGMKVTAQVLLEDDVILLSHILHEDPADRTMITRALEYLQPLTPAEYSMRWPMQSEFVLGYARSRSTESTLLPDERTLAAVNALARTAHLYPEDFRHIEFGQGNAFFGLPTTQTTWNAQATQYDQAIRAIDTAPGPRLVHTRRDVRGESSSVSLELNPAWDPFEQRLAETDARLRLVSLQILMRKPTATVTVPTRLAEVGSRYFDPFTGFPMLWSPTQHTLYSVGKDGLDDGGDAAFDISVPLTDTLAPHAGRPAHTRATNPS